MPAQKDDVVTPSSGEVSKLLRAWTDGDRGALDRLTPIVYDELHRLAQRYMKRERPGHSLQTTVLVNEAYMRLVDYRRMQWQNRAHFFAVSAQLMRRILVEHARRHDLKRGRSACLLGRGARGGRRPGHGHGGAARSTQSAGRRNALLWRTQRGRDSRSAQSSARHPDARLEQRQAWLYRELTGGKGDGFRTMETSR